MSVALLLYPHQLFRPELLPREVDSVWLIEDPLFFRQYAFHVKKLLFHRATMKLYEEELRDAHFVVRYVDSVTLIESEAIGALLSNDGTHRALFFELDDDWLDARVRAGLSAHGIDYLELPHPLFLTPRSLIDNYRPRREFFYFSDFYQGQRKRLNMLVSDGKPVGGQWSYDAENRKKLPRGLDVPSPFTPPPHGTHFVKDIEAQFPTNPGSLRDFRYPITRRDARAALDDFIAHRLASFGPYEDAISSSHPFLFHSILSPLLNVGLLEPGAVADAVLDSPVPLSSKEGCLRQIIGWREFVRLIYHRIGRRQRTINSLSNERPLPRAFYDGTTGIEPFDVVVKRVVECSYCHHIERLMILGNFFLLCDIDPDEVYRWFMELFIDSYDWVMVPNVYGMSQYADGGLMTTKPYVSGSSYILKMSDFKRGPWCEVWDGLYWRFIDRHKARIAANPRMSVMSSMRDKLHASGALGRHLKVAEEFLDSLT